MESQIKVIAEILNLSNVGETKCDLSLLDNGKSKSCGVMTINKNITSYDECILINQSITGLYENRIDLLQV